MTKVMKLGLVSLVVLNTTASGQQAGEKPGDINFLENRFEVKGLAAPGRNIDPKSFQGYATARRGAVVDANRNIAEVISDIQVDSSSLNEASQSVLDSVKMAARTRMRGGQVVSETSLKDYMAMSSPGVTVIMWYPISGSGGVISAIMPALRPEIIKRQEELKLTAFTPPPQPVPIVATTEYDALIIRVPAQFKPSLAPKVFTDKGEILYSATDVAMDILNSRGAAQFTINEGKAKTILEGMGAKMLFSVEGSLRTDTDAEVKSADATKIYAANKKTTFLNKARVVFLVGKS